MAAYDLAGVLALLWGQLAYGIPGWSSHSFQGRGWSRIPGPFLWVTQVSNKHDHTTDATAYMIAAWDNKSPWFDYYDRGKKHPWAKTAEAQANAYYSKLLDSLTAYTNVRFDHIKIGHLGRRIAVFVVKGNQSAVLYDKTKGFPSAKLLASLVLLGSP